MNILEIYRKYNIPKNIQDHQLRVAAVASFICDDFNKKVDKKTIVEACLLHDMGNIIKSNFDLFPDFLEPEGREYWETVKTDFIKKYGDHIQAPAKISKELNVNKKTLKLLENFKIPREHESDLDIQRLISVYSDNRVAPLGVVSTRERLADGRNRYVKLSKKIKNSKYDEFEKRMLGIKKPLFEYLSIIPEDINDKSVKDLVEELKDYDI